MKGCIVAAVVLALVIGAVAVNACFVRSVTRELLERVENLPEAPNPLETPTAIGAIYDYFETKSALLGVTVPYTTIDRISETLLVLETHAKNKDILQYKATLTLLCDLVDELSRNERITAENILAHIIPMSDVSHVLFM